MNEGKDVSGCFLVAKKLYETHVVVAMQEGAHPTQTRCQWAGPLEVRRGSKRHGREAGRGNLDWGWGGLIPQTFFSGAAIVESKRCGGFIGSPLECNFCIVDCWPNGDQSLHSYPVWLWKAWSWFSSSLPISYRHPFIVTMQPGFVTLPVERGAWGLPRAFSPAPGLRVTAHLPQCWPCCGFSVRDDAVSCSSVFSRVATLWGLSFSPRSLSFVRAVGTPG